MRLEITNIPLDSSMLPVLKSMNLDYQLQILKNLFVIKQNRPQPSYQPVFYLINLINLKSICNLLSGGRKSHIRFISHVDWLLIGCCRRPEFTDPSTSISGRLDVISAENTTTHAGCGKFLWVLQSSTFIRNSEFINHIFVHFHPRSGWKVFVKEVWKGQSSKRLLGSAAGYVSTLACLKTRF